MNPGRNLRVAGFLAIRSLARGNLGVTLMTVLMLAVVFISVVFLPSLINGAVANIQRQVTDTATADLVVTSADRDSIDDADAYLARIREADGVTAATGVRRVGNQIAFRGESDAWGVDAIDPDSYDDVFTTPGNLIEGDWLEPDDTGGIVLGIDIAGADQSDRRGYSGSLRHVHVGDRVRVTMIGGATKRFAVRGIFDNRFVLSDQGAFITTGAVDTLEPATDLAGVVEDTFDALEELTGSVGDAADAAETITDGQAGLGDAVHGVADAAGSLAARSRTLDHGTSGVGSSARQVADAAGEVRAGAKALRRNLARLSDQLDEVVVPTAVTSAQQIADAARTAAELAAACPAQTTDPTHCADEAAHAEDLADVAATAGRSAGEVTTVAASLEGLTGAAGDLAKASRQLHAAASDLADGASDLADGSGAAVGAADAVQDAALSVASSSEQLTTSTAGLAESLHRAADVEGPSQNKQDQLTGALQPKAEVPAKDTVTRVFIRADRDVTPQYLQEAIEPIRGDVEFHSSQELTASIQDQIETFGLINNIMRLISLIVAAITVFILTYVELTNRRRQIGIERAIGIRGTAIVLSYVLKSAISALIGIGLGLAVYRLVLLPYVEQHPFEFPNGPVVLVAELATTRQNVVLLVVVAVLAALVPTLNTVRMRILDAIWGR
ncbi:FtsX-like permease family protein [Nocardioides sp. GY 10113]|uniref:ABC transporter permease n=1 Tax=Nocardioides sp. GY 10113 TaxID=2569761 RepID=UPI0010A7F772|nr:FtsX-like permease family protein [Nocardioides sp. GY 10113]TIC87718.1 FtsX-like permease family protein [Nocardioides sp. GY 10113]